MDNIGITIISVIVFVIPALLLLYIRDLLYKRRNSKRDKQIKDIFSESHELIIYRRGDGIIALASMIAILGGYASISANGIALGLVGILIGIFGFLYFFSMTKYVKRMPYIVVNGNGLIHPYIGFIPWSDIVNVSYHTLSSRHQLHILKLTVDNIEKYLLKRPLWQRMANIVKPKFIEINIGKLTIHPSTIYSVAANLLASYNKPNKASKPTAKSASA